MCSGTTQSPINIGETEVNTDLSAPVLYEEAGCKSWYQFSNNYTFEMAFVEGSETLCNEPHLTYQGNSYTLLQVHFHSPSEHSLSGSFFSAEAHLVHKNPTTGSLLVLGVFLQASANHIETTNNTLFQALWDHNGPNGGTIEESEGDDVLPYSWLVPTRRSHYTYSGSLTTPPCTPGVRWIVFDQPVMISQNDLELLRRYQAYYSTNILSAYGNNNRFPQPDLNDRTVYYVPSSGSMENDDKEKYDTGKLSVSAIVLAAVGIVLALIAIGGWVTVANRMAIFEKNQRSASAVSGTGSNPHYELVKQVDVATA